MRSLSLIFIFAILMSYTSLAQQSCDYKVEILVDGEEFESEDFKWRMRATKIEGKSTNITGTAEIKADGRNVKSYKPWTLASISKQKTSSEYSPNLNSGKYEIIAEIKVECDDANNDNNIDTKTIKIKGEVKETINKKSKNENIKTDNDQAKSESTINKQINNNLIETKSTQKIAVKKSAPEEEFENTIQLNPKTNKNQQLPVANTVQNPETIYESSNERVNGLIMLFLLTLSILLNIILIWKR